MSVRPDRVIVLPMLVVAVALIRVSPAIPLTILALVGTLGALPFAARFSLTRNEQGMVGVAALSAGILLPRAFAVEALPAGAVTSGMYALGLASQLSGIVRLYQREPVGGPAVTGALGLVALSVAGRAPTVGPYLGFVALYILLWAWSVAAADPGRPRWRRLGARHVAALLAIGVVASGFVVVTERILPPAHARLVARLLRGMSARSGFTDSLALGEMRGMTMSSELVARLRGAPADHLRGVVFRKYDGGRWEAVGHVPRGVLELGGEPPVGEGVVELELPGRPATYPVPLGAASVWSSSGFAEVEKQGVLRPSPGHRAKRLAFVVGPPGKTPGGVPDVAGEEDLGVPRRLRPQLAEVLERWGIAGRPPREAAYAIRDRLLRDYGYSLEFRRTPKLDPVIDFLTKERRGHCEYFASAAALLSRAAGVPARVVGGYRVTERSPLADYAIVRERDAHAWVEVFLDERWETLEVTPAGPLGAVPETPRGAALLDLLSTSWEVVDDWLARRSQLELSLALVVLLFAFVGYRALRSRSASGASVAAPDLPLPAFEGLSRALEAAGIRPRGDAEPIESFARRVREAPLDARAAELAADALAGYAALRYGAPRDERDVERRLADAAAAWRAARGRSGAPSAPRL